MIRDTEQGSGIFLRCTDVTCGRKVMLRRPNELVVIDHGDFSAFHRYASDPMSGGYSVLDPLGER